MLYLNHNMNRINKQMILMYLKNKLKIIGKKNYFNLMIIYHKYLILLKISKLMIILNNKFKLISKKEYIQIIINMIIWTLIEFN